MVSHTSKLIDFSSKITFWVEGADDTSFLQGYLRNKGLASEKVVTIKNGEASERLLNEEGLTTLVSHGGIDSIVNSLEFVLPKLKDKHNEYRAGGAKEFNLEVLIILVDNSSREDEQSIIKIETMLENNDFPCPERNTISDKQDAYTQVGLYVLKDMENSHYEDLESLAIHTLKETISPVSDRHTYTVEKFSEKVLEVLKNYDECRKKHSLYFNSKESKRRLAVALSLFPNYEGNPQPILRKDFEHYFDVGHSAFDPLQKLVEILKTRFINVETPRDNDDHIHTTPNVSP
jgi:hypothetical protein